MNLVLFIVLFNYYTRVLHSSIDLNKRSGKINDREGIWDIDKPVISTSKPLDKGIDTLLKRISWIKYLAPAFGMWVARYAIESHFLLISSGILYLFCISSLFITAQRFSIIFTLINWEKENQKKMMIEYNYIWKNP
jgi:hypothetical protein